MDTDWRDLRKGVTDLRQCPVRSYQSIVLLGGLRTLVPHGTAHVFDGGPVILGELREGRSEGLDFELDLETSVRTPRSQPTGPCGPVGPGCASWPHVRQGPKLQ